MTTTTIHKLYALARLTHSQLHARNLRENGCLIANRLRVLANAIEQYHHENQRLALPPATNDQEV